MDIFYQDTDSMHLIEEDVIILEEAYRQKYNSELVGKDLGQFHEDFEEPKDSEKDILDNLGNVIKAKFQSYAIESIFLGKKCYYDKVIYKTKKGKMSSFLHYRMKGVPQN